MESHQAFVVTTNSLCNSFGHGSPDSNIFFTSRIPVATQYPDNILSVFVAASDPVSIDLCIFNSKDLGAFSPAIAEYFIAPGRKKGNV
jgi:hypothetical protein